LGWINLDLENGMHALAEIAAGFGYTTQARRHTGFGRPDIIGHEHEHGHLGRLRSRWVAGHFQNQGG
jgi:hypothetical protein